jgi:hypothetical protein
MASHDACPDWTGCPAGAHIGNSADFAQSPCASKGDMTSGLGSYTDDVFHFSANYDSICSGNWNHWDRGVNRCNGPSQCGINYGGYAGRCSLADFTWRQDGEPRSGTRTVNGCYPRGSACSRGSVCVQDW